MIENTGGLGFRVCELIEKFYHNMYEKRHMF